MTNHQDGCPFKDDYTRSYEPEKVGTPEEIMKALHYYLDWLKAVEKRKDDHRGVDALGLLKRIQAGHRVDTDVGWDRHYTGT